MPYPGVSVRATTMQRPPGQPRWTRPHKVAIAVAGVELIHYGVLAARGDPLNFGSLLSLALAVGCIIWVGTTRAGIKISPLRPGVRRFLRIGAAVAAVAWLALVVWIAGGARSQEEQPVDVVLVLGAGLKNGHPTPTLERRIDTASVWLLRHPGVAVVACGGMAPGQPMSEAAAIRDGLVARGVARERILLEDRSITTEQNLRFARELLLSRGAGQRPRALVATSNFHLARAKMLASRVGFEPFGLPASTPWYSLPNCVARESLAMVKSAILDGR